MELYGISEREAHNWIKEIPGIKKEGKNSFDFKSVIRSVYKHQREQAAGRAGGLAQERTRLAKEQADKIELENMVARKEYAPISVITDTLASVSSQVKGLLEAMPVKLKREAKLNPKQMKIVEREIAIARNVAADVKPEYDKVDQEDEG